MNSGEVTKGTRYVQVPLSVVKVEQAGEAEEWLKAVSAPKVVCA